MHMPHAREADESRALLCLTRDYSAVRIPRMSQLDSIARRRAPISPQNTRQSAPRAPSRERASGRGPGAWRASGIVTVVLFEMSLVDSAPLSRRRYDALFRMVVRQHYCPLHYTEDDEWPNGTKRGSSALQLQDF